MLSKIYAGLCLCILPFHELAETLLLVVHWMIFVRRSTGRLTSQIRYEIKMDPEEGTI